MVILVPLASTARRAPSSSAARVRFIALPARVRVPVSRTGAADAIGGGPAGRAVDRNSVSNSGSAISAPQSDSVAPRSVGQRLLRLPSAHLNQTAWPREASVSVYS